MTPLGGVVTPRRGRYGWHGRRQQPRVGTVRIKPIKSLLTLKSWELVFPDSQLCNDLHFAGDQYEDNVSRDFS